MQYQVIDTAEEGKVVGTYPTFRKAFNAARRLEPAPSGALWTRTARDWRYLIQSTKAER